jgi:hypothetical protein
MFALRKRISRWRDELPKLWRITELFEAVAGKPAFRFFRTGEAHLVENATRIINELHVSHVSSFFDESPILLEHANNLHPPTGLQVIHVMAIPTSVAPGRRNHPISCLKSHSRIRLAVPLAREGCVKSQMTALVRSWIDYSRQQAAMFDRITSLVRAADERFEDDEDFRDLQLKELQRDWYRVILAEKLGTTAGYERHSPEQLLEAADGLLCKKGHGSRYGPSAEMRTADEERMYASLRVRWSKLLKRANVRAADNRGGPFNPYGRGGKHG